MPILTAQERVGTVLDGKYRLDRVLGEGGMGVVYDGVHLRLDRRVAVKFLHAQFSQSTEVVERFLREAQATSKLQHPNVVAVHDVDVSPDGCVFMVLEFLEGQSFAQYLEEKHSLPPAEVLSIIGPVCEALATAHAHGIVHRDIKPDNVYLSRGPGGRMVPKVLDFGIAKLTQASAGSATQTGSVMGTPLYMSPEQAMGRTKDVGPHSDLWSTAVMTYEALAGRPPFDIPPEATATAVVLSVVTGDVHPLRRFRPELGAISDVLDTALTRSPEGRYKSVTDFFEALRRASSEPKPSSTRPGHGDPEHSMLATMMAPSPRQVTGPVAPPSPAATRSAAITATPFATTSAVPAASGAARPWLWASLVALGVVAVAAAATAAVMSSGAPTVASGGPGAPPTSIAAAPSTGAPPAVPPAVVVAASTVPASTVPASTVPASTVPASTVPATVAAAAPDTQPETGDARPGHADDGARHDGRRHDRGGASADTTPAHVSAPPPPTTVATTGASTHRAGGVSLDDF